MQNLSTVTRHPEPHPSLPVDPAGGLGTPISSVTGRLSISNETFDIEYFDIECSFDIDVFYIRYRLLSISKVFDIE